MLVMIRTMISRHKCNSITGDYNKTFLRFNDLFYLQQISQFRDKVQGEHKDRRIHRQTDCSWGDKRITLNRVNNTRNVMEVLTV
jgi:hypothetical protein